MESYTIIVPDNDILQRLCGTNDKNLKLIENYLGVNIFARGNELSIESSDEEVLQKFRFVIDRILDEMSDPADNTSPSELIRAVLNIDSPFAKHNTSLQHADFSANSILIPGSIKKVYPRTKNQSDLVQLFRKYDMVFASGPAGTGKTFLAVVEALRLVLSHQKSGIILTRPVVEAGESLGFLPGDLEDKINPYLRPLYDAMNAVLMRETVHKMTENGIIEIAPLAYMRGRTMNDCVVILDEAQNTTVEQMKMFLTRMGEGCKMFITGDASQIDLPKRMTSGFVHALNILEGVEGIGMCHLNTEDVVRNELVKRIVRAYENEER